MKEKPIIQLCNNAINRLRRVKIQKRAHKTHHYNQEQRIEEAQHAKFLAAANLQSHIGAK